MRRLASASTLDCRQGPARSGAHMPLRLNEAEEEEAEAEKEEEELDEDDEEEDEPPMPPPLLLLLLLVTRTCVLTWRMTPDPPAWSACALLTPGVAAAS